MARTRHIIPTHLRVVDKVIVLGEIGLSARQLLLLLIGSSLCYDAWLHLRWLDHWILPLGAMLHWLLLGSIAACTLTLCCMKIAGRSLEHWLMIWLRYWTAPRWYVWRSPRRDEQTPPLKGESTYAS